MDSQSPDNTFFIRQLMLMGSYRNISNSTRNGGTGISAVFSSTGMLTVEPTRKFLSYGQMKAPVISLTGSQTTTAQLNQPMLLAFDVAPESGDGIIETEFSVYTPSKQYKRLCRKFEPPYALVWTPTESGTHTIYVDTYNLQYHGGVGGCFYVNVVASVPPASPLVAMPAKVPVPVGRPVRIPLLAGNDPLNFGFLGDLPKGVIYDAPNQELTGVYSGSNNRTVRISATNAVGDDVGEMTLVANPAAPCLTAPRVLYGALNASANYPLTCDKSATFSASGLPGGLALNASTGVITGTPAQTGTGVFLVTAQNTSGQGITPVAYNIATSTQSLSVAIAGSGSVTVGFTGQSQRLIGESYTVTATPADGNVFVGWTGGVTSSEPTLTFVMTPGLTLTANFAALPDFWFMGPLEGNIGVPLTYSLSFVTNVTSFSATGLPDGLSIDSVTGTISGTPTQAATGTFRVCAINSVGNVEHAENYWIAGPPIPLSVTVLGSGSVDSEFAGISQRTDGHQYCVGAYPDSGYVFTGWTGSVTGTSQILSFTMAPGMALTANFAPLPQISNLAITGTVGLPLTYQIQANNGAISYGASNLPGDLSVDPATGVISGTPTLEVQNYSTLTASSPLGQSSQSVPVKISPAPLTLTVSVSGSGSIAGAVIGANSKIKGKTCVLIASPADGYAFTSWSGGLTGTNAIATFTMTSDMAVTANFGALPASSNQALSGTAGTPISFEFKSVGATSFSATGLPDGLSIDPATGVISGTPALETSGTAQVTVQNACGSITVSVSYRIYPAPCSLVVAVSGSGSVTEGFLGTTVRVRGNTYSITATPAAGNVFKGWSGSIISGSSTVSFTMADGLALTATFGSLPQIDPPAALSGTVGSALTYQVQASDAESFSTGVLPAGLTITAATGVISGTPTQAGSGSFDVTVQNANGSVGATIQYLISASSSPLSVAVSGSGSVTTGFLGVTERTVGTTYDLAATPAPGYVFKGWSGGVTSATPTISFTMTEGLSLTATFAPLPRFTATGQLSGTTGTPLTYALKATDATSYAVTGLPGGLTIDGTTGLISGIPILAGSGSFQATARNANGSVSAAIPYGISIKRYALTVAVSGSGSVPSAFRGTTQQAAGKTYIITATPAAFYVFKGWSGSLTSTNPALSLTLTKAMSLVATFAPAPFMGTATYSASFTVNGKSVPLTIATKAGRSTMTLTYGGLKYTGTGLYTAAGQASYTIKTADGKKSISVKTTYVTATATISGTATIGTARSFVARKVTAR